MMAGEERKFELAGQETFSLGDFRAAGQLDIIGCAPRYVLQRRVGEPGMEASPRDVGHPVRQEVHRHVGCEIAETVGIPFTVFCIKFHLFLFSTSFIPVFTSIHPAFYRVPGIRYLSTAAMSFGVSTDNDLQWAL